MATQAFMCIGCNKGLTGKFEKYVELVNGGMSHDEALDKVEILKLCCRNSAIIGAKHKDKAKRDIPDEERKGANMFWCVGCQKNIAHMFENYRQRVAAGEKRDAIMADMGITDDCCIDTLKLAEQARA